MRGSPRAGLSGATVATLIPTCVPPRAPSDGMSRNWPERKRHGLAGQVGGGVEPGVQRGGDRLDGRGGTARRADGVGVEHQRVRSSQHEARHERVGGVDDEGVLARCGAPGR